jgi:hypothetical protein
MKTTINLPDVLVQQARQKALHLGRPFKGLVAEYIRQGLSELSATAPTSTSGALAIADDGLPVFRRVPSVQRPVPTLEELLTLEQSALAEEDRLRACLSD